MGLRDSNSSRTAASAQIIDTSIVLTTCSRAEMLRQCLESLLRQTWMESHVVEIIVVDDGSTDNTAEVLSEFQRNASVRFTILHGQSRGVAAARNLGCHHASGRWIASFDDDQIAFPTWLSSLRTLADEKRIACVGGALALMLPNDIHITSLGPRVRRVLGEHLLGSVPAPYSGVNHPATNNVLIRRDIFEACNGYDTRFTEGGEDKDFFERVSKAGHSLWFQPDAYALHMTPHRRLDRDNLRWTSLRLGAADARVFLQAKSRTGPIALAIKRLAVTVLRDIPQWFFAEFRADERSARNVLCSLWYTQGLVRAIRPILSQKPERSAFMRSINFRSRNGERPRSTSTATSAS